MRTSRFTDEQIIGFLKQAEAHLDIHALKGVFGLKR
jgi:hypothetical protein